MSISFHLFVSLHAHSDASSRTTSPIILISFIFLFVFPEIIAATSWVVTVLFVHSLPVFFGLVHAVVECKMIDVHWRILELLAQPFIRRKRIKRKQRGKQVHALLKPLITLANGCIVQCPRKLGDIKNYNVSSHPAIHIIATNASG